MDTNIFGSLGSRLFLVLRLSFFPERSRCTRQPVNTMDHGKVLWSGLVWFFVWQRSRCYFVFHIERAYCVMMLNVSQCSLAHHHTKH